MTICRVGIQGATCLLCDVAKVAQQRAFMAFFDVRSGPTSLSDATEEVIEVFRVTTAACDFVNDLALHVIDTETGVKHV